MHKDLAVSRRIPGALPAVVSAWRSLGLTDTFVARTTGISTAAIGQWCSGTKPVPTWRGLALVIAIGVLADVSKANGQARGGWWFRRTKIAADSARAWVKLAHAEFVEAEGGAIPDAVLERALEGASLIARRMDIEIASEILDQELAASAARLAAAEKKLAVIEAKQR
jgi:hypothetical protein